MRLGMSAPPPSSRGGGGNGGGGSDDNNNDNDDFFHDLVNSHGCGAHYKRLEACLESSERSFGKCQEEIKLLKKCYENFQRRGKNQTTTPE